MDKPLRVDLIRSIKVLPSFDEALDRGVRLQWGTRTLPVLALDDYITSTREAGRAVDRSDLRALEATVQRE